MFGTNLMQSMKSPTAWTQSTGRMKKVRISTSTVDEFSTNCIYFQKISKLRKMHRLKQSSESSLSTTGSDVRRAKISWKKVFKKAAIR